MQLDYRSEAPQILRDFLAYHETIKGHSKATVDEYYLDLRNFFRFIKLDRGLVPRATPLEQISIDDVDLQFAGSVKTSEVYEYLAFLARDKIKNEQSHSPEYGLNAASRARKISTLRSFYKYLTIKTKQLDHDPVSDLDSPKTVKSLPHYLTLEESERLLNAVDGKFKERDYCIICLFLNCGLRISELIGLNIGDVREENIRVLGKGGKERIVYLNDACRAAIDAYLPLRSIWAAKDCKAFFVSIRHQRMSRDGVHHMVKNTLLKAGLDASLYSSHKLRHTAATLMIQNGVDVRTVQEVLGHTNLNTTQIYTHVDNSELHIAADANPLAHFDPNRGSDESDKSGEEKNE